ncbi:hypothetical protein [Sphingomonas zeae]|nr:hypothetical protein [Sphingomonas zeae]
MTKDSAMQTSVDDEHATEIDFGEALKARSDEAARAMLARGRFITYRERDTPQGHVVREYPNGTRETVRIELPRSKSRHA